MELFFIIPAPGAEEKVDGTTQFLPTSQGSVEFFRGESGHVSAGKKDSAKEFSPSNVSLTVEFAALRNQEVHAIEIQQQIL